MGEGELFGEVRAVVHGANTHIGWSDLCLLLEGSDPESYRSRLEPYLSEMLASWSDEVRVVPVRWLAAACAGEPTPWLGLARHLYVSKDILEACATPRRRGNWRDSAERRGARLLSALEQLRGVTVLDIEGEWPDGYHFETLCASEVFDGVRSLTVEHVRHDGQGTLDVTPFAAFQGSPLSHGIERLDVALGVSSGRLLEGWACGLSGGGFETLRSLALDGSTERLAYLLEELMRAPGLDGLTSFSWAAFADLSRDVEVLPTDMPNLESLRFAFTRGRYEGDHVARVERVVRMLEACGASRLRTLELDRVNLREGRVEGVLGALGPDNALEELRLTNCHLDSEEARALAEFEGFGALRALDLGGNKGLGPKGGRALFDGLDAPNLEALSLRDAGLKNKWLGGLARFEALRELDLSGKNALREAGGGVVSRLPSLEFAVLDRAGLNSSGVEALGAGPAAASLRFLDVSANRLGREGVRALVESDLRPEVLYLGRDQVISELDGECMRMLAQWEGLSSVRTLSVCNSKLKQKDLMILLRSEHIGGLEYLDMSLNSLGKAGAVALSGCEHLRNLRGLGLSCCGLREPGFRAFSEITFLTRLAFLSLSGNDIDQTLFGDVWFDVSEQFPALNQLDMGWSTNPEVLASFGYARAMFYSKEDSSRWIPPWVLPTSAAQPTYLGRWERR